VEVAIPKITYWIGRARHPSVGECDCARFRQCDNIKALNTRSETEAKRSRSGVA